LTGVQDDKTSLTGVQDDNSSFIVHPSSLAAKLLPGQVTTEGLIEESVGAAAEVYQQRIDELGAEFTNSNLQFTSAEFFDQRILPLDFLGQLGNGLTEGMVLAAQAGRRETQKRRNSKTLKAGNRGEILNARKTGVQDDKIFRTGVQDDRQERTAVRRYRGGDRMTASVVGEYAGNLAEVDFFRLRAFTMAHVEDQGILDALRAELEKVLQGGGTWADFRSSARGFLDETITDAHLQTVFQTNLQTAYNAGKYYEGIDAIDVLPYWEYVTVGDDFVRPAHAALDGRVWRKDNPVWDTIYPPNGFNCRCSVVEHDAQSLNAEKLKAETLPPTEQPDAGFGQNAARSSEVLTAMLRLYKIGEKLPADYGIGAEIPIYNLQRTTPPNPPTIRGGEQFVDYTGLVRTIAAEAVIQADAELIAATLQGPAEVWGWPGKELTYLQRFLTPPNPPVNGGETIKTLVVTVWGEVQSARTVVGNGNEFRKGMLLYKR